MWTALVDDVFAGIAGEEGVCWSQSETSQPSRSIQIWSWKALHLFSTERVHLLSDPILLTNGNLGTPLGLSGLILQAR